MGERETIIFYLFTGDYH